MAEQQVPCHVLKKRAAADVCMIACFEAMSSMYVGLWMTFRMTSCYDVEIIRCSCSNVDVMAYMGASENADPCAWPYDQCCRRCQVQDIIRTKRLKNQKTRHESCT
jgi:hypothetical protein